MRQSRNFLPMLTAIFFSLAALLCPLVMSCNGTGGTSDSEGETYVPGGNSGSSSGSSGIGASSGGNLDAIDILNMANSGDTDSIVATLTGGAGGTAGGSNRAQTVTLDADAIGLPAGGTVTLTITGRGVDYNVSASADADGKVTFTVPAIVTGTEVTVTLVVKAANGAVMYAGSTTQVLSGDEFQMNLSLTRQYWVMPSSISVTATPNTLAYDPVTLDSDSVTFNIQGLADAPAGVEYRWTDEAGSVVGTGATLTRTVNQILGAGFVPTQDEETRTYSVAVSYTDATGESKSLTASAEVTVVTTATIVLTGGDILTEDGRQLLVLKTSPAGTAPAMTNLSASVICYGGTATFGWSLPGSGEATLSGTTGDTNSVTPQAGGMATLTVTATLDDGSTLTKELDIYVLQVDMTGTSPAGHDLSENSSSPTIIAEDEDAVMNMTASLVGISDLAGAEFEWVGVGAEVTTLTLTPSGAGNTACALVPKEAQEDGITLKAKITWRGVLVQAERYIKVVGLRLGLPEDIDGLLLDHAPTATNQLSFELTPVGFALTDGLNSPSWAPMSGSIATVAPGTAGTSIVVTAATGPGGFTYETGVVEVTFSASLGADAIPLTAKRKVTVLDFVMKDGTGAALPAMNCLTWPETKDIVAELKGPPADATVTYSWENGTPAAVSLISPSPAGTATVKLASGDASGSSDITVTATYDGNDYTKTVTFAAGYIVDVSSMTTMQLDTYLTNLLSGLDATVYTKDNPAKLTLTGLPEAEWSSGDSGVYNTALGKMKTVADAIRSSGAYLDLSETQLPDGTPLYSNRYDTTGDTGSYSGPREERGLFSGCTKLVKAPQLPVNNTTALNKELSLDYAFRGCTNLTEIPEIPAWVNDLVGTFENCTSLEDLSTVTIPCPPSNQLQSTFNGCSGLKYPPAIADGVTQLPSTFGRCTSLLTAPTIPNSVTQMGNTFNRCTSLKDLRSMIIPSGVINLDSCFIGCTSLTVAPDIPNAVTDMDSCFNGCKKLTRAPVIPASVTSIERCFAGCESLGGNVVIKASISSSSDWLKTFGTPNAFYLTPLGLDRPSGMTVYVPAAGADGNDIVNAVINGEENDHLSAGTYGTDAGTPCKVIAVDTTAGQTWPDP